MNLKFSENAGIKFIHDESLAQGGVFETTYDLDDGTPYYSMRVFPTEGNRIADWNLQSAEAGGLELRDAHLFGSTPEEVLATFYDREMTAEDSTYDTAGEVYHGTFGGVGWAMQDYTGGSYQFKYGSSPDGRKSVQRFSDVQCCH